MALLECAGEQFTSAVVRFDDSFPSRESATSSIYVRILVDELGVELVALVDTGAPYCIIPTEIADELALDRTAGQPIRLSTRVGRLDGVLQRIKLTLLADEGEAITVDATVFVPDQWDHVSFLGYAGFLERLNFGVRPSTNEFFFGPADD